MTSYDLGTTSAALCEQDDPCLPDLDTLPPSPGPVEFTSRTTDSLTFEYPARADWTSHRIERRPWGGTTWSVIRTYGTVAIGPPTYTNLSLSPDTPYCYRIRAVNPYGTRYSSEPCAMTMAGGTNPVVRRLQLRVKIANVPGAGTSDPIDVALSGFAFPGANRTGLNYAARPIIQTYPSSVTWVDNFAKGSERIYDLDNTNIKTLRDINQIQLTKHAKFGENGGGTDAVCIERLELLVNGATAYNRTFGPTTCRWLDNDPGYIPSYSVSLVPLRATPSFAGFVDPPRFVFGPDGRPATPCRVRSWRAGSKA